MKACTISDCDGCVKMSEYPMHRPADSLFVVFDVALLAALDLVNVQAAVVAVELSLLQLVGEHRLMDVQAVAFG